LRDLEDKVLNPYSTERLQKHCRNITLETCNVAATLHNIAATLQEDCSNVEMSALREIAMQHYSNIAM